jgi:uncharacterized protein (UPF0218 family)
MEYTIERGTPLPGSLTLVLPDHMREELKIPMGPVIDETQLEDRLDSTALLATVGDMTTVTLHRMGYLPQLAIVDYQTKREKDPMWEEATAQVGETTISVVNEAATITPLMYNTIIESWTSPATVKLVVVGEEDLAALPAILHAPEGATVIYGIPDMGLCLVHVDEGARGVASDAMSRFSSRMEQVPP